MKARKAKLIVSKSGGTASKAGVTFRATLPTAWVREMGLGEDSRDITLTFDGSKIIIEKESPEMKKVLISCYYGQVFVECPRSTSKEDVFQAARGYFQEKLERPIITLENYTYETESEWMKRKIADMDRGEEWRDIPVIEA